MPTVLIADDDRQSMDAVRHRLLEEGYDALTAQDGPAALDKALAMRPDVALLNWSMPGLTGLEVARRIRAKDSMPILLMTGRNTVEERVLGLDAGADDCLGKPFATDELLARVRALLRRSGGGQAGERRLALADLRLDPTTRIGQRGARRFSLTPTEYELLRTLLRHPRQVLTREAILEQVWGYNFGGKGKLLEVYIGYLRAKTEAEGEPRLIQTVHGVGYVLREVRESTRH